MPNRWQLGWLAAVALTLAGPGPLRAHELTGDVTVQGVVAPVDGRLDIILRVPLSALGEAAFPVREDGGLDISIAEPAMREAVIRHIAGDLEVYEDGALLPEPEIAAVQVSLETDRSLGTYETALAHVTGPALPAETELPVEQAMLDVLLRYPMTSSEGEFSLQPGWHRLGEQVVTVLRFVPSGGVMRAFEFLGDPGMVRLDPSWFQAALRFVVLGFEHILDGIDHLLFLFCLVIPFRKFKSLIWIVTSFTLAHSVTLIASAFGYAPQDAWFPPLIETGIAASIVYMAIENIYGAARPGSLNGEGHQLARRRALVTFGFGLVHGFGFSFVLHETLQFAGDHLLSSLLAFNVGVELGQLVVLAILVPVLAVLFRFTPERWGTIALSSVIAWIGGSWMVERWAALNQLDFPWPGLDAEGISLVLRAAMFAMVIGALIWRVTSGGQRQKPNVG